MSCPAQITMLVLALSPAVPAAAQQMSTQDVQAQLSSPDWRTRRSAFYELLKSAGTDENLYFRPVLAGPALERGNKHGLLLDLLRRENEYREEIKKRFEETGALAPAGYYDYFPNLLFVVTTLQDSRSIEVLIPSADSGMMVIGRLADFGGLAIHPLLESLKHPPLEDAAPGGFRHGVYACLVEMLRKGGTKVGTQEVRQIEDVFLGFKNEQYLQPKLVALQGLAYIGGAAAETAMEQYLAETVFDEHDRSQVLLLEQLNSSLSAVRKMKQGLEICK